MIINKVEIDNFLCYVEHNEFIFEEGLNIISAKNSAGKSHLFNAFHWAFFNKIYVDKDTDTSKKEWKSADNVITLPDYIVSISNTDEIIKSSVKITLSSFFHENEDIIKELVEYHFEKEISYKKGDKGIIIISKPELNIWYIKGGETSYLDKGEHEWFLNKLFPVSLRKFMWFQGETVDELYDFNNPSTLNYAIKEISYFPIYENLVNITNSSVISINKKIDNELRKVRNLSFEQEKLIADIENYRRKLDSCTLKIHSSEAEIDELKKSVYKEEDKLKGFDKYTDLKAKLNKLEYDIKITDDKVEILNVEGKEKFISKWMLNKCERLIKDTSNNFNILSDEIKTFQKTDNPVPITLPGPEYVQKMIDDHICYICERPVEDNSPPYHALMARMEDFRNNQIQKLLSDNYTELNRFRRNLLSVLPNISVEVKEHDDKLESELSKKRKLYKDKDRFYQESGVEKTAEITIGSSTANQIVNKIRSLNDSKSNLERRVQTYETEKNEFENILANLLEKKSKNIRNSESEEIVEIKAGRYIDLINKILIAAKNDALNSLMGEITAESNVLYSKYLGGNTQGKIEINRGIRIIDKLTNKTLTNLNTAELTAQKLAVANAFLSLSEKKMNRSFPLLADAPTSQFDDDNTLFLTENLADSFQQIIIMSKDYTKLKGEERTKFISRACISKYYELTNGPINIDGMESRSNRKTFINTIK